MSRSAVRHRGHTTASESFSTRCGPERCTGRDIKAIEVIDGKLTVRDLGVGNCPTSSPAGDRIAFWLNSGGVPGAQAGIWLMQTDGSQRRLLGSFGRPKWSPNGSQFMIIDFAIPAHVSLMDVKPDKSGPLRIPDLQFYSVPSWASEGTIVAVVGAEFGDTIALVDVTDPARGKVTEVLWKMNFKGKGLGVSPLYPAYTASTRRCVFIGKGNEGMAIYSFQRGQADQPKRLEARRIRLIDPGRSFVAGWPIRFILQQSNRPAAARICARRRRPKIEESR